MVETQRSVNLVNFWRASRPFHPNVTVDLILDRLLGEVGLDPRIRSKRVVDDLGSEHQGDLSSYPFPVEEDLLLQCRCTEPCDYYLHNVRLLLHSNNVSS